MSDSPRRELRSNRRQFVAVAIGWVLVLVVSLGLWEIATASKWANPVFFGQPSRIGAAFMRSISGETLRVDALYTFAGSLIGFLIAAVFAVLAAFVLSQSSYAYRVVEPFFTALNSLPRVALAPIFLLWFGIGLESKIALAASLAFFVVFSNTISGIQGVQSDHVVLARTLGASRWQIFKLVVIPASIPSIFTGLELGFIYAMLAAVAGEMLAGEHGLGVKLQYFASSFATNDYFATLLLLVVITATIAFIIRKARTYFLRWQSTQTNFFDEST